MAEPRRGTKSQGTKQTKSRRVRTVGTGTKSKRKQKAVVGEEGFWERSPGKRDCDYRRSIQFWVCCCGCLGDKHPRASESKFRRRDQGASFLVQDVEASINLRTVHNGKSVQALLAKEKKPGN